MTLSASASARGLACPASLVLPQQDYRTKFADAGNERHDEQEEQVERGDLSGLPDEVRELIPANHQRATELSFAYDPVNDTARVLGKVVDHDYKPFNLGPFEIPGTIDLGIVGDGRGIVIDYKGWEEVDEAGDNDQVATYSLMLSRAYGYDDVTAAIVYLVARRRPSIAVLSSADLRFHRDRLRQLQLDVAAARKNPTAYLSTGNQCRYCPAFLSCPLQAELRRSVDAEIVSMQVAERLPLQTDEDAADVYELWGRIKMLSKRIGDAIIARAGERPIPLPSGKVFGFAPSSRDELDGDITYEVVRAKYGQQIADVAVERSATKTKLREALGFVAGKGRVAAYEREVLELVKERNGIASKQSMRPREYTPQPLLKAVR